MRWSLDGQYIHDTIVCIFSDTMEFVTFMITYHKVPSSVTQVKDCGHNGPNPTDVLQTRNLHINLSGPIDVGRIGFHNAVCLEQTKMEALVKGASATAHCLHRTQPINQKNQRFVNGTKREPRFRHTWS